MLAFKDSATGESWVKVSQIRLGRLENGLWNTVCVIFRVCGCTDSPFRRQLSSYRTEAL